MTDSQKSDETASAQTAGQAETGQAETGQAENGASASADHAPAPPQPENGPAAPLPGPRPEARPAPTPAALKPRPGAGAAQPAVAAPPVHTTSLEEAAKWARVDETGHVFLLVDGGEHAVGQYPDAPAEEALAYFARKYDDVAGQITLLEQRVAAKAPTTEMLKTVKHLREQVAQRSMVGDVLRLESRLSGLATAVEALKESERAEHESAKAAELAAREAIVAEAEEIAGKEPATVQWKHSSARMNELFEAWKSAQKNGVRLGRGAEDALWKRFRSARTVFDRHRRAYFSALDNENAAAKAEKEALIAEAETLSTSTDWGATAGEYRRLMDQWKASKRASRKDDDALWARFRAAQDTFFAARQEANEVIDHEYAANLVVKEALVAEARALLPVRDLKAAKKGLQSIRDRWEAAGKVPRADMGRIEAALRSVEDEVRKADEEHWRRSDPETKARTNSALSQLESAIAGLEDDLEQARKAGNAARIKEAEEALSARRQWLDQIQKSAGELH